MTLRDKVVLITGAASGIGRATSLLFAREGACIAALGHNAEELKQAVADIRSQGGQALPVVADIADAAQMQAAVGQIIETWDRIDSVFANAGINGLWAPIEDIEPEEWDKTINVNLRGTFLTVKYAVPYLKRNGGSIIITSSVNGTRNFSNTGATAYSCSKAAQVAFAKMIAVELGQYKIRVNVICPGAIESEIQENTQQRNLDKVKIAVHYPEGRSPLTGNMPGKAEQVAWTVRFLASEEASHITGTEIWIDGGESLLQG